MSRRRTLSVLTILIAATMAASAGGQRQPAPLITRAADALGGVQRIRSIRNITVAGYG